MCPHYLKQTRITKQLNNTLIYVLHIVTDTYRLHSVVWRQLSECFDVWCQGVWVCVWTCDYGFRDNGKVVEVELRENAARAGYKVVMVLSVRTGKCFVSSRSDNKSIQGFHLITTKVTFPGIYPRRSIKCQEERNRSKSKNIFPGYIVHNSCNKYWMIHWKCNICRRRVKIQE
jgi:hypothetical protein